MSTSEAGTGRSRISDADWELGIDAATSPTPAVRGVSPGREGWTGSSRGEGLATVLGMFSVGFGAMQLVAPGAMTRLIGLRPGAGTSAVMRAMGLRELAHGAGILAQPRSKEWVGTRIGGDLLDLALLGAALAKSEHPERTLLAAAAVLGVTALDVRGTEQLAESRQVPRPEVLDQRGSYVLESVTVERPRSEVYAFWRDLGNLPRFMRHLESVEVLDERRSRWRAAGPTGLRAEWEAEILDERENELLSWRSVGGSALYNAGTVRFRDAPAGRGTIVTAEMRYSPPGGKIGAAMLKLLRREPGQRLGDDLRRFKQVMETGEILLSDATAVPGPHPARPAESTRR